LFKLANSFALRCCRSAAMVGQVKLAEDPIKPLSFSSAWRTTMALMEVFRDRPAPACAFLCAVALWMSAICRMVWPHLMDPIGANVCLTREVLYNPLSLDWRKYALHPFWPLEFGYIRGFLLSAVLLLEGYTLEYEVGTASFMLLLVGLHSACAAVLLYFNLAVCHVSLEPVLVALGVVMHRVNPKVHTDGLDKSLRVPFMIEPRWHLWIIQSCLLMLAEDFPRAMIYHAVGLAVGGVLTLRDPEVWVEAWTAARQRSFGIGAPVHIALLLFTFTFMPLTGATFPDGMLHSIIDGSAFSPSWWQTKFPGSPPLLHMAMLGAVSTEAYLICKLMISFVFPLLVSPFRIWTKFYAGGCILLLMYTMNSESWHVPHLGFATICYLVWALWKLPGLEAAHAHRA